jgi:hypothetical protein
VAETGKKCFRQESEFFEDNSSQLSQESDVANVLDPNRGMTSLAFCFEYSYILLVYLAVVYMKLRGGSTIYRSFQFNFCRSFF